MCNKVTPDKMNTLRYYIFRTCRGHFAFLMRSEWLENKYDILSADCISKGNSFHRGVKFAEVRRWAKDVKAEIREYRTAKEFFAALAEVAK